MLVPKRALVSKRLKKALRNLPRRWNNHYDSAAKKGLLQILFHSLVGYNDDFLRELFCGNVPELQDEWNLRASQGAVEGAEYTETARGKPCGHILRNSEASYRCKTCASDVTCVLCARCFEASDHQGHQVTVSMSPGNAGCCDCGDPEAWKIPVNCAIHSAHRSHASGKGPEKQPLPQDMVDSIAGTVGAVLDYFCDVMSCAPEELRRAKTEASIKEDEARARLLEEAYEGDELTEENPEWSLVLWNDEKHAVHEVQEQVARACKKTKQFGLDRAHETDEIGRSFIMKSRDLKDLLNKARIIEQIKITVTIRSARDTFREEMCSTIIEWLTDISGCKVGDDNDILSRTICTEMLEPWEKGSQASNSGIGRDGIYDHSNEENEMDRHTINTGQVQGITVNAEGTLTIEVLPEADDNADEDRDDNGTRRTREEDAMDVDLESAADADLDMPAGDAPEALRGEGEDSLENSEATIAGYPPPPPPPIGVLRAASNPASSASSTIFTPPESVASANIPIPKTPYVHARPRKQTHVPWHWLQETANYDEDYIPPQEDIRHRLRLDWMILYDLRLWKKARTDLRNLYMGTILKLPGFRRIFGLRFTGLYTVLSQLYLIADREPDHSIIYLSVQTLTTPSITKEVVDRCNFLSTLLAILYTFLTTRQVGRPMDIAPQATLAFDTGSVTNRRMYHHFMDVTHMFQIEYVKEQLRTHRHYTLQFLDLIKLPQGICPNQRAIGEHVEYETDAWISASLLTREINKLCRHFAEAFRNLPNEDQSCVQETIHIVAVTTIANSLGLEKDRFMQAEVTSLAHFKRPDPEHWNLDAVKIKPIVSFVVEKNPISFHHAMHYTLAWLIDGAKHMTVQELRELLYVKGSELGPWGPTFEIARYDPETYLMVLFDYPLRVCAWLAQMKASMWVRNGLSLRHQMGQYRAVSNRHTAHQHDVFLLQVALVVCEPNRVLMSIVDRFGMSDWMRGKFSLAEGIDDAQMLDVAEDFVHLLIILLSERTNLQPLESEAQQQAISIRRDLTHVLCFKPLSYSDLCQRVAERFQELDEFQDILSEMTNFKGPEGLSDTGSFELKKENLANLDPYIAHYTKNQRDEAEAAYREWVAEKTAKPMSDVVYEPQLRQLTSGVFVGLSGFVGEPVFAQIIQYCLVYALDSQQYAASIPLTRVESFLQVVLHLVLLATNEDPTHEDSMEDEPTNSFVHRMLTRTPAANATFGLLYSLLERKDLEACHSKIKLILIRMQHKRPKLFHKAVEARGVPEALQDWASPMDRSIDDLQKKKKAESEARAKRALASMQKQQADFVSNSQNFDWGSDLDDEDSLASPTEEPVQMWDYPSGNCIYCQEECGEDKLYGTFALLKQSTILRTTDTRDGDYVNEILEAPESLDRSADSIRPFGLAGKNRDVVRKFNAAGDEILIERQTLGKGFKPDNCVVGPVSSSCGHIMHYNCFESYNNATIRRQTHQIARHHPERISQMEFICPLCKALGNSFLPIIWRGKEKRYPGVLDSETTFGTWISEGMKTAVARYGKAIEGVTDASQPSSFTAMLLGQSPAYGPLFRNSMDPAYSSPLEVADGLPQFSPTGLRLTEGPRNTMPGNFPDDIYSTSPPLESAQSSASGQAMTNVYYRLRETVRKNKLNSRFTYYKDSEELAHADALARALGHSVAAVEIAQRGVDSQSTGIFVDKVSPVTMTHLRVLSDMITSYTSAGAAQGKHSRVSLEIGNMVQKQLRQLFRGNPDIVTQAQNADSEPILTEDPFNVLAECTLFLVPKLRVSYGHIIRLCCLLEIVKNVHVVCQDVAANFPHVVESLAKMPLVSEEMFIAMREHLDWTNVMNNDGQNANEGSMNVLASYIVRRIRPNLLTFLRKVTLLVTVTRGVDFESAAFFDPSRPELERLTHALRLPNVVDMLRHAGTDGDSRAFQHMKAIVLGWIEHLYSKHGTPNGLSVAGTHSIRPTHPVIFELVGLPKYYDTLLDEMTRRKCPTKKNKEMMDAAVCLFCGEMMCSQSVCCTINNKGGCNRHMQK